MPLRLFWVLQSFKGSKQDPVRKVTQMCLDLVSDLTCLASPDLMFMNFNFATNKMTIYIYNVIKKHQMQSKVDVRFSCYYVIGGKGMLVELSNDKSLKIRSVGVFC